jgi:MFS family permease
MAAAFALGGKLIGAFAGEPEGWRWALYCLCGPLILATLAMLLLREPQRTDVVVHSPSVRESWRELWRYRAVIAPLLIGMVTVEVAIGAALVWAAPTFTRDFNLAPDRIGGIMAAALLVSGIAGPVAGGVLADFCQRTGGPPRTTVMLSGLALLSAAAGLFALLPDATPASVLLASFMTLVGALLVAGSALFMIVIPNEMRGLCMGVLSGACMLFGVGIAPLFVSVLSGVLGGGGAIGVALTSVCVVAGLLGAATFALGSRAVMRTAVA